MAKGEAHFKGPLLFFFVCFTGYISLRKEKNCRAGIPPLLGFYLLGQGTGFIFPFSSTYPSHVFGRQKSLIYYCCYYYYCYALIMIPTVRG